MTGLGREERSWVRGARAGAPGDLEALFRMHWPRAYRAAHLVCPEHAAAEEITQEAFLAAVRTLETFDAERPFGPWLHRTILARAVDRAKARLARLELASGSYFESTLPGDWYGLDGSLASPSDPSGGAVAAGLAALSPEERAALVARFVLDYPARELASVLDVPRRVVLARLGRAVEVLARSVAEAAS